MALGLLAHALVGASASQVLGYTLTMRIVVIVLCSQWAGHIGERFEARAIMIRSDIIRVSIVSAFFFVDAVWQIYVLAIFLNLGSALFTPIYKAVIPGVVTERQYPKALAIGSVAYDVSSILGPALAGWGLPPSSSEESSPPPSWRYSCCPASTASSAVKGATIPT